MAKDYTGALQALAILTQGASEIHGQHVASKIARYDREWQQAEKEKDRAHEIDVMERTNELALKRLTFEDEILDGNREAEQTNALARIEKENELAVARQEAGWERDDAVWLKEQIVDAKIRKEGREEKQADRDWQASRDYYNNQFTLYNNAVDDWNALEEKLIQAGIDYEDIADSKLQGVDVSGGSTAIFNAGTTTLINQMNTIGDNIEKYSGQLAAFNSGLNAGALIDANQDGKLSPEEFDAVFQKEGFSKYSQGDLKTDFIKGAQSYTYGADVLQQMRESEARIDATESATEISEEKWKIEEEWIPKNYQMQYDLNEVQINIGNEQIKNYESERAMNQAQIREINQRILKSEADVDMVNSEIDKNQLTIDVTNQENARTIVSNLYTNIDKQKVILNEDKAKMGIGLISEIMLPLDDDGEELTPMMYWLVGDETGESSLDLLNDSKNSDLAWIKSDLTAMYGAYHTSVGEDMVPDYDALLLKFKNIRQDYNVYNDFEKANYAVIENLKAEGKFTPNAMWDLVDGSDLTGIQKNQIMKSMAWNKLGILDSQEDLNNLDNAIRLMMMDDMLTNSRFQVGSFEQRILQGQLNVGEDESLIPEYITPADIVLGPTEDEHYLNLVTSQEWEDLEDDEETPYYGYDKSVIKNIMNAQLFSEGWSEDSLTYRLKNPIAITGATDSLDTHWALEYGATFDPVNTFWDYTPAGGGPPIQVYDEAKIPSDATNVRSYISAEFPTLEQGEAAAMERISSGLARHDGDIDAYVREFVGGTASEQVIANYKKRIHDALGGDASGLDFSNLERTVTPKKKTKKEDPVNVLNNMFPQANEEDLLLNKQELEESNNQKPIWQNDRKMSQNLQSWSDALDEDYGSAEGSWFGFSSPEFSKGENGWEWKISRRDYLTGWVPYVGDYMAPDLEGPVYWHGDRPYMQVHFGEWFGSDFYGNIDRKIYLDDTWAKLGYETKAEYFKDAIGLSKDLERKMEHFKYNK